MYLSSPHEWLVCSFAWHHLIVCSVCRVYFFNANSCVLFQLKLNIQDLMRKSRFTWVLFLSRLIFNRELHKSDLYWGQQIDEELILLCWFVFSPTDIRCVAKSSFEYGISFERVKQGLPNTSENFAIPSTTSNQSCRLDYQWSIRVFLYFCFHFRFSSTNLCLSYTSIYQVSCFISLFALLLFILSFSLLIKYNNYDYHTDKWNRLILRGIVHIFIGSATHIG